MLVVFAGLPGTGKTTLSRELARELAAVHLRIDTIECALREALPPGRPIDDLGYRVAYALADSVNPLTITREAWHAVAKRAGVPAIDVEVICSDAAEHRRRVETRLADIAGHKLPAWDEVLAREYHGWTTPHIVVDTAGKTAGEALAALRLAFAAAMDIAQP